MTTNNANIDTDLSAFRQFPPACLGGMGTQEGGGMEGQIEARCPSQKQTVTG